MVSSASEQTITLVYCRPASSSEFAACDWSSKSRDLSVYQSDVVKAVVKLRPPFGWTLLFEDDAATWLANFRSLSSSVIECGDRLDAITIWIILSLFSASSTPKLSAIFLVLAALLIIFRCCGADVTLQNGCPHVKAWSWVRGVCFRAEFLGSQDVLTRKLGVTLLNGHQWTPGCNWWWWPVLY